MPWTARQLLQGGKYVIGEVLGQGGFGITYKALHVELNRQVVIKTPNEHLSHDPEYDKYIERFIKEGQTLAHLSQDPHPHIVGVIDLFQEGSTHCLVMNFVPGENLFKVVRRRGALPEAEIVHCIRQIGEALMVVHQAGLVHRDAHPGNIMLRSNGKAVLIDFGIAKELVPKTLSSTGDVGNKGFAPYEQLVNGSREPTVDVYCLAATLYYAVTGQCPTTSLARKYSKDDQDTDPLISPKEILPSISDQLNQAILKGMVLEAKDRPQSMRAWLDMLEPAKAVPPPPVELDYTIEDVRPRAKSELETTPDKPVSKPTITISWGWVTASLRTIFWVTASLRTISWDWVTASLKTISWDWVTASLRTSPWGWLAASLVLYGLMGYFLASSHPSFWTVAVSIIAWTGALTWGRAGTLVRSEVGSGTLVIVIAVVVTVAVAVACAALTFVWAVVTVEPRAVLVAVAVFVILAIAVAGFMAWADRARIIGDNWNLGGTEAIAVVLFMAVAVVLAVAVVSGRVGAMTVVWGLVGAMTWAFFVSIFVGKFGDELQISFSKFHTFLILVSTSALGLGFGWLGQWIFKAGS